MGEAVVLGSLSIFDRVFLGLDEAGQPVDVLLAERNLLIGGEPLTVNEFTLEIRERLVIELELPLERAIGHTPPLAQQRDHLIHHCDKIHRVTSRSVVVPACASAPSS